MTALSLRRLWTIYKKILADDGMGRRDLILAQHSFYSGARGVLKVLGRLAERGEYQELHKTIERQNRQIKALQGLPPRAALNGNVVRLHGTDDRTVFTAPEGGPLDYKNFRDRVWATLLESTGPDAEHPKRVAVTGTMHMLRHSYATALIQSGENAKTVQTLMGHHSVAFTMDQYADAWPEQIASAGEAAARLLLPSGSKTVAASGGEKSDESKCCEVPRLR